VFGLLLLTFVALGIGNSGAKDVEFDRQPARSGDQVTRRLNPPALGQRPQRAKAALVDLNLLLDPCPRSA
jgi:hypothetical protein